MLVLHTGSSESVVLPLCIVTSGAFGVTTGIGDRGLMGVVEVVVGGVGFL